MLTQELFDKAVGGVIAQGRQSKTSEGCMYLSGEGCKCALGHLLPTYDAKMEGKRPFYCDFQGRSLCPELDTALMSIGLTRADKSVLIELQRCHDEADQFNFVDSFKMQARGLCSTLKLIWNHN